MPKANKRSIKFMAKGHLSTKIKNSRKKYKNNKQNKLPNKNTSNAKNTQNKIEKQVSLHDQMVQKDLQIDENMNVDDFLDAKFLDEDNNLNNNDEENDSTIFKNEDDSEKDYSSSDSEDPNEEELEVMKKYLNKTETEALMADHQENIEETIEEKEEEDDDEDDEDDDELAAAHDKKDSKEKPKKKEAVVDNSDSSNMLITSNEFSMKMLKELEKQAFDKHSLKSLMILTRVFNENCVLDKSQDIQKKNELKMKYQIHESNVYNRLMVIMLSKSYVEWNHHLNVKPISKSIGGETDEEKENTINETEDANAFNQAILASSKWSKVDPLIRRFFLSIHLLMDELSDDEVLMYLLRQLNLYVPYLCPFPRLAKKLLKGLLILWSSNENDDVRMLSFLRIRQLCLRMPFPFIEMGLKTIYLTYMRNVKFTNEMSLRSQTLMGNCVVELYGIDTTSSYQHAFVYIRQLSLILRQAFSKKTKEALKAVMNWQFLNCLKVWIAVLCAYSNQNQLRMLIYPLSQILMGVMKLLNGPRMIPFRFHCIRLVQQLAVSTESFIPTTPQLLDILHSNELKKKPKGSLPKPIDLQLTTKLSKTALDTHVMHDVIVSTCFDLLTSELDIYKFNISYPELTTPIITSLRKFVSNVKLSKWSNLAKGLMDSLKKQTQFILSQRSQIDFCPKDVKQMETFLSSHAASAKKRRMESIEKENHENMQNPKNTPKETNKQQSVATKKKKEDKHQTISTDSTSSQLNQNEQDCDIEEDDIVEEMVWSSDDEE